MSPKKLLPLALLASAAVLSGSVASAGEEFRVSAYCPMPVSRLKAENPGNLHTVPGRVYSVYARYPEKGKPEWVQVYADDKTLPLRWVEIKCAEGAATAEAVHAQQQKELDQQNRQKAQADKHGPEYKPLKSEGLCPLFASYREKTNPGDLHTVPGRRYAVYALNAADPEKATWAHVYSEDSAVPLRWLSLECAGRRPALEQEDETAPQSRAEPEDHAAEPAPEKKRRAAKQEEQEESRFALTAKREAEEDAANPSTSDVQADATNENARDRSLNEEKNDEKNDERPELTPFKAKGTPGKKGSGVIAPSACAKPKAFDAFNLAMVWHPGRCAANPKAKDCAPAFAREGWTLYGLWPESKECGAGYGYCGDVKYEPKGGYCAYPALNLPETVRKRLYNAMPAAAAGLCLQRHEWYRHGTCFSGEAASYFTAALDFTARIASAEPFHTFLRSGGQRTLGRSSVEEALNITFGPDASKHFSLLCEEGRFTELRLMLPGDANMTMPLKELIAQAPAAAPGNCGARFWIDVSPAKGK